MIRASDAYRDQKPKRVYHDCGHAFKMVEAEWPLFWDDQPGSRRYKLRIDYCPTCQEALVMGIPSQGITITLLYDVQQSEA